jgi:Rrf2 family protein
MRISARCDYALGALLELSIHWPNKSPVPIQDIAKKQGIPIRYLVQILIRLKSMKLVESTRGKQGGYRLKKNPVRISLGDVIRDIEGPLVPVVINSSPADRGHLFEGIWKDVEKSIAEIVDKLTFEDLCNRAKGAGKVLNYSI